MKLEELKRDLKNALEGEVRFDEGSKALYTTDGSNYRQVPLGVVVPKSKRDIVETMRLCREHGVPVLSRGGGTALAGQTCNAAVVMDHSKYYNRILELNVEEGWARVQPGIVLDELRDEARKHGLTFGPDPATHSRCTLGGMMGNDSCGVHSVMAGRTADNVYELEVLTYDGAILRVGPTSPAELETKIAGGGREGEIYRGLRDLRDEYASLVRKRYPKIPRRVSGYNLDNLLPESGFNVARALVGSEGTCVCILEAKLRLVHNPSHRTLVVAGFDNLWDAAAHVAELVKMKEVVGLEGLDDILVDHIKKKHLHEQYLKELPKGKAWLLIEAGADSEEDLKRHTDRILRAARALPGICEAKELLSRESQEHIWQVREAGLGATAFVPGQKDAWEGWEDSAVPPENLSGYLREFRDLLNRYGYQTSLYGHFGQGCVHCRISFDFVTAKGIKHYHNFTVEAAKLVVKHGGSLSGEHGDGQSRGELLPLMFGPELVDAFRKFKRLWDPLNRMNPGKKVDPFSNTENLRLGTGYHPWTPETAFAYPDDHGSFARAALRCVGVGACRQHKGGVMCPSYQVTREEKHSTRGRAHLLFEMMEGEVVPAKWRNEPVKEALDLCLSCKGCKGECPVNVDMATYKAEFLHHYYRGRLRPRHAYAFGYIGPLARLASHFPRVANFFTQTAGLSGLAKWAAGISSERQIPAFALETFRDWYAREKTTPGKTLHEERPKVILWPDTFNNYFHPRIAKAAVASLEGAGFDVQIPGRPFCCGRPLYDFGFLDTAKRWLCGILDGLREEIRAGTPFVFLEPSCASVFRDELGNLLPHDQDGRRLKEQSFLLSEFLADRVPKDFEWPKLAGKAWVQGHCHDRSVLNHKKEIELLGRIVSGVEQIPSGCCGMAGSFGFEADHYEVSQAIGEMILLPKVRGLGGDDFLVADGFSCREQIRQATGREARHLAELIELALAAGRRKEERAA